MRLLKTLFILVLLLSITIGAQAFQKTVLVEYFTNTGCVPCAGQHDPIVNMLTTYTRDQIAYICYHVNWPSPSDPYYLDNTTENSGRWGYYGVNSVPWFEGDGIFTHNYLANILPQTAARIGLYTPYEIDLGTFEQVGNTVPMTATVTCAEATGNNKRFNMVLLDKEMVYPPGGNGIDDYQYNMLDMAYGASGQSFTSNGGNQELEFTYTFNIPGNQTFGNLAVVAYVQDYSTSEIFQSRFIASPEVVIQGTVSHGITGSPLWLAVVQLNGGADGQTTTNENGLYGFSGLDEGDYTFDVFMTGYEHLTVGPMALNFGVHQVNLGLTSEHDVIDMVGCVPAENTVKNAFEMGNYAYCALGLDGFAIADITDLAHPDVVGDLSLGGEVNDVVVSGNYAYCATANGLSVVNVSNPANPTLVTSVATNSSAFNLAQQGNYLYAAAATAGLCVFDVTNPASPNLLVQFDTPGYARDVAVSGDYACIADGASGLSVIDISTPASPSVAGTLDTNGYSYGIKLTGNQAYVADDQQGVKLMDLSNPTNPQLVVQITTTGRARQVALRDNFLFVAEYTEGLRVYDVTNPMQATQVAYSLTPGTTSGVEVFGDNAYVADSDYLLTFDLSGLAGAAPAVLELTGINTNIPANGGVLSYSVHFAYNLPQPANGIEYWSKVTTPGGGTIGPIMNQTFNANPGMDVTVQVQHDVPGNLNPGTYTYHGYVGNYPTPQLHDSFTFTKAGAQTDSNPGSFNWPTMGGFENLAGPGEFGVESLPLEFALESAYPNPFNPSTTVYISLPEASDLTVTVYNVLGEQVSQLMNGRMNAGRHALSFNAGSLASGLYFIRATVPGHLNAVQKVMLVR